MKLQISQFNSLASLFLKWSFLFIWLLQSQALADDCTGDQITLVDKNKKFVQCAPCPPCPPGQEYTIACRTTVSMDTVRTCINCPRGKFSRKFDTKPCADCRRCTKRHIKRVCTSVRNAKCGDCLAGYFYSRVVMGCIDCDRCCNDSKDERPLGCKTVGMCKPRLSGCPTTAAPSTSRIKGWLTKMLNKSKVHSTPNTSTFKASSTRPLTEQATTLTQAPSQPSLDQPEMSTVPEAPSGLPRKNEKQSSEEEDSTSYNLLVTAIVILAVAFGIVILVVIGLVRKLKSKERPQLLTMYSRPVEHQPPRAPNDRLLKDFYEQETDVCDEVCELLYILKGGMYDFDRIAIKFQLTSQQRQAIENVRNTPGGSPPREFIDTLCTSNPDTTVKHLAYKAKEISRNDVYRKLEPFFTIQ